MKYLEHLFFILFLNYVHVLARKFDCSRANSLLQSKTNFHKQFNGKDYWVVKHLGYPDNLKSFGYNRVTYAQEILTETTYFMDSVTDRILMNKNFTYEIHDKYLAFHAIKMAEGYVEYKRPDAWGGYRLEEPSNVTYESERTTTWDVAYVHYNAKYDFFIQRTCDGKYATVDVGDHTYRTTRSGDTGLKDKLHKEISKAISKVGLEDDGSYNEPNYLLNIFPLWS